MPVSKIRGGFIEAKAVSEEEHCVRLLYRGEEDRGQATAYTLVHERISASYSAAGRNPTVTLRICRRRYRL